ncbi:MAG: single-stranded-DNA-specific exonuclease RecJ [Bdellovibrionales bacterium]|nr:single-stranded-DNA-specific exonuclease RecJ [Oligoflexia bacterium]
MNWIFKNELPSEEGSRKAASLFLSQSSGLGLLASTVCVNRGIKTVAELEAFLNPKLESLTSPFKIKDLEIAVDHILKIQTGEKIRKMRVYTDYDVDGTTGAALLTWFFRDLGFNFDVAQPDRFKDGYGLNPPAIIQAHADGVDTLITVDCGITNFEAAEKAKELGITLIIVDHHLIDPVRGLPPALAVIDPQRSDCDSGLKQLCGCALGFYLCMGLRTKARDQGYFEKRGLKIPNLKNLLDLVVIATAADMVPLTGDNRTLIKHGLDVLRQTDKPGLRALIEKAGIEVKTLSPSNLGFALGPRINASGRMGSAETAYRTLTTKDREEGIRLAQELESVNAKRAELQNLIWDEVREQVTVGLGKGKYSHAVVVASNNWHEGVVGIVASKVVEHFKKPAIVLAIREDGLAKGSVRSYGGYNVLEALHLSKSFLKGYGGHKFAAGLSLDPAQIEGFCTHYNQMMQTLIPNSNKDDLHIEALCSLKDLDMKALGEIEKLAPFGPGNPEPIFAVEAVVHSQTLLKGRHLKLKLSHSSNATFEGIWFNAAERIEYTDLVDKSAQQKKTCVFAGIPEINRFLGRTTPTLRIKEGKSIL